MVKGEAGIGQTDMYRMEGFIPGESPTSSNHSEGSPGSDTSATPPITDEDTTDPTKAKTDSSTETISEETSAPFDASEKSVEINDQPSLRPLEFAKESMVTDIFAVKGESKQISLISLLERELKNSLYLRSKDNQGQDIKALELIVVQRLETPEHIRALAESARSETFIAPLESRLEETETRLDDLVDAPNDYANGPAISRLNGEIKTIKEMITEKKATGNEIYHFLQAVADSVEDILGSKEAKG